MLKDRVNFLHYCHCRRVLGWNYVIYIYVMLAEGLPSPAITWWVNGSQIGRQVMDKNFKIRGLTSQSELFVLPTTDRLI